MGAPISVIRILSRISAELTLLVAMSVSIKISHLKSEVYILVLLPSSLFILKQSTLQGLSYAGFVILIYGFI